MGSELALNSEIELYKRIFRVIVQIIKVFSKLVH